MILLIWMFSMWQNLTRLNPNLKISIFLISNYQVRGDVWSNTIWNFIWTYILILKGIAEYVCIYLYLFNIWFKVHLRNQLFNQYVIMWLLLLTGVAWFCSIQFNSMIEPNRYDQNSVFFKPSDIKVNEFLENAWKKNRN